MKQSSKIHLRTLVLDGARQRYGETLPDPVTAMINHELDLIARENLEGLFIILADIAVFANKNNILLGPGKGYTASSIVNYCVGITGIDPVANGLVFERLIQRIIASRADEPVILIDADIERVNELKIHIQNKYDDDPALSIIDLSGQKSLHLIAECLKIIHINESPVNWLSSIPLDNVKTFDLLANGDTNGIMVFEDSRIRKWLKKMKPNSLADLCVLHSLTGGFSMESKGLKEYIYLKKNNIIKSRDPLFSTYLEEIRGMVIYQEQIINIFADIGNFSKKDSVQALKDLGRLHYESIQVIIKRFMKNANQKSFTEDEVRIMLVEFREFMRLKSHFLPAALICYWMAYLKAHFREEFITASKITK